MSTELLKLTGLWSSIDKNGNTILTGSLNAISRMVIMPNTFKTNETAPDYYLYLSQAEKPLKKVLPLDKPKVKRNRRPLNKGGNL